MADEEGTETPAAEEAPVTDEAAAEEAPEETVEEAAPEEPPAAPPSDKTAKIQVDPNASLHYTKENHCLTAVPVLPEADTDYVPMLYTFRVRAKEGTNVRNLKAKPPPFYLQFDHAIAVIWSLFNKDANQEGLGINQLQWALYFLQSIYNDQGTHPKDVQLCIDTIQDYLIDEYAAISHEKAVYGLAPFSEKKTEETNVPFSSNYVQMINKCPPFTGSSAEMEDDEVPLIEQEYLDELLNVKNLAGIDSIDVAKVVSKEQVMNILADWKKEQLNKITDELKMLRIVEDMMKHSDSQNFEGYTDETQFQSVFKGNKQ